MGTGGKGRGQEGRGGKGGWASSFIGRLSRVAMDHVPTPSRDTCSKRLAVITFFFPYLVHHFMFFFLPI